MTINVFDTPGFDDTDNCREEENQKLIASHITTPIDVFAYFLSADDRIDQTIKNHFRLLQKWTYGNIWKNLLIVYNRVDRSYDMQLDRAIFGSSIKNSFDKKIADLKQILWRNMTVEHGWTRKNDNSDELIPMQESDFDNIRYVTLNVGQNRLCNLNSDGIIDDEFKTNQLCWKLPNLDQNDDYIMIDYNDDYNVDVNDKEWVLVDDIRKFQNIIKEFSDHPVSTQTMFLRKQLKKDKQQYLDRHMITEEEQAQADEIFKRNEIDITKCQAKYENVTLNISDNNCPQWSKWKTTECSKECGQGKRIKSRECLLKDETVNSEECLKEFVGEYAEIEEDCMDKLFCEWMEWGNWSPCSKSCNVGITERNRTCPHDHCEGSWTESKSCNTEICISEWSEWEEQDCSSTCGSGLKTFLRRCLGQYCGNKAEDINFKQISCNLGSCPTPKPEVKHVVHEKSSGGVWGNVLSGAGGALLGSLFG